MNQSERVTQSIIIQSLYLCNLLLLPGIAFLILLLRLWQLRPLTGYLKIHIYRALQLSLLNGVLLVIVPMTYITIEQASPLSLMMSLFFFICLHAGFVLVGMINLSRAMANKLPVS